MDTRTEKRKESMKKKKRLIFMLFFLIIFFTVGYIILPRIRVKIEQEKCDKIYANKILKLPDKEKANVGFTCTGLYWDKEEECFFIGNAGKYKPNDKTFQASIEIVEKDFSAIKGDIPCYLKLILLHRHLLKTVHFISRQHSVLTVARHWIRKHLFFVPWIL